MPIFPFLARIPIWWIRVVVLGGLGLPLLSGWPINVLTEYLISIMVALGEDATGAMPIASICAWGAYGVAIWFVVFLNTGGSKFLEYLSVAVVLALTTAFSGALIRKLIPFLNGDTQKAVVDYKMCWLCLVIMITVPFTFMSVNLFSAKGLLERARAARSNRFPLLYLHVCLALRMLQHVGEVVTRLLDVWREEHPSLLLPRNRREWKGKWYSSANFLPWATDAVSTWIFACMMMTFAPLSAFVHELESIKRLPEE